MKQTIITTWMAAIALVLLGVGAASAQSLGDYARSIRKDKPDTNATDRHYDNDNLPTDQKLSVVGPAAANSSSDKPAAAANSTASAQADTQKSKQDLQSDIDTQKEKMDSLNHELELEQREYRLRAVEFYSDAGNRLRNSAQWDKDDAKYKSDLAAKQKDLDAARQQLENLQEQGRKAGLKQKDEDSDTSTSKDAGK